MQDDREPIWPPTPPCPDCGPGEVIPIAYGRPGLEAQAEARAGKVVLGGCIVYDEAPRWYCKKCRKKFGRTDEWYRQCRELNPDLAREMDLD